MKIVFKANSNVKMYSGEVKYRQLKEFVEREFPGIKNWDMSLEDEEGDSIMINSDIDIEVMVEMFPNREFMKVNIESLDGSKSEQKVEEQKGCRG